MKTLPRFWMIFIIVALGVVSRIIPHLPNTTAIISASLLLGYLLPRTSALLATLLMAILSDILISSIYHYPLFGSWSVFTYSGLIFISFIGSNIENLAEIKKTQAIIFFLGSSLGFWVWTNLGVWLISGLYTHNLMGLLGCYIAALPFLKNQLLGDCIWMIVFLSSNFNIFRRAFDHSRVQIH